MLIFKETKAGAEHPLDGVRITVGRDASNDIVLDDPSVSGFHAVFLVEAGEVQVTDLGSRNGTRVEGVASQGRVKVPLWGSLELGNVRLELVDPEQRAPTRVMQAIPATAQPSTQTGQTDESDAGRLVRRSAGAYPEVMTVHGEITVGRAPDATLRLAVDTVSSRHARLVKTSDGCEVIDENSSNGTWVNDQRIQRRRLRHGDRVRFDAIEYEWLEPGAAPVAATRVKPAIGATVVQPRVSSVSDESPSDARAPSGGTAETHPEVSATAVMNGLSSARTGDQLGYLFSRMLSHYSDYLPGALLLLVSSVLSSLYLAFEASTPYYATTASPLGIPPGREWETVLLWGGAWVLQIGAWFALLRAAGAVQGVRARDSGDMMPRLLAYGGTWLLVTALLALVVMGVTAVGAMMTLTTGPGGAGTAMVLTATALAVVLLYLALRLWPLFVQLSLFQEATPVSSAWRMTARPGALTQASWPVLGWFALGSLLLLVAGFPVAWNVGWPGWVFAVLLGVAWIALIAPWLAMIAVNRWQHLSAIAEPVSRQRRNDR